MIIVDNAVPEVTVTESSVPETVSKFYNYIQKIPYCVSKNLERTLFVHEACASMLCVL